MHESQPPPIIVHRPVTRPRDRSNFWLGVFAGAVSVAALWLLASFAHFALVEDPAAMRAYRAAQSAPAAQAAEETTTQKLARLEREITAVADGGLAEWRRASVEAQILACLGSVRLTRPNDARALQQMKARLFWAVIAYQYDQGSTKSFTELFDMGVTTEAEIELWKQSKP